ncbi:ABC transporter ATP-binding protein [Bradyrhizobium sp.]|uniref:ABC transporter ATP-binding protein n=1 Tax=Bradyrhizobium sp. TaxID=376 RepID=UPI0039E38F7E
MRFGGFAAVDDVSLGVQMQQIRAVIGPNGAGKSTLFSCLAGTLVPTAGRIHLDDTDITTLPVAGRARLGLVKSFQTTTVFPRMTVGENVAAAAIAVVGWSLADIVRLPGSRSDVAQRVTETLVEVNLIDRQDVAAEQLSHGQQRRLELGIALASGAKFLLLDEPTAGMGIDDIKDFKALILRLRERCGILLVEHNMDVVLGLSDRITVMAQGRMIFEGTPDEVRRDPDVRNAYLGRQHSC